MIWRTAILLGVLMATNLPSADLPTDLPFGIPAELYEFVMPKDNPNTPEKIALGMMLYNDKRLSSDGTVSCATCHETAKGFTDQLGTSKGVRGQFGKRNAPTVLNAMFLDSQFLDGRVASLEEQAMLPLVNPIEMGLKDGDEVVQKVAAIPQYKAEFQKVFGRPVNYADVGRAIAAFERTLMSGDAPIDRFMAGDENALSPAARRGWTLFNGKAQMQHLPCGEPIVSLLYRQQVSQHRRGRADTGLREAGDRGGTDRRNRQP